MAYARPTINIFKSDFSFLSDHFRPSRTDNENKKCYRIICLKNNGHQGLKSDKISFRVDHTTILYSDANWGRKVKTKLSDFKRLSDIMKIPRHGKYHV